MERFQVQERAEGLVVYDSLLQCVVRSWPLVRTVHKNPGTLYIHQGHRNAAKAWANEQNRLYRLSKALSERGVSGEKLSELKQAIITRHAAVRAAVSRPPRRKR